MNPAIPTHVYAREVGEGEQDSLSRILPALGSASSVLDVGTGSGAMGRHLTSTGRCVVDGVTYNEAEAALARPCYRRVEVLDLERESLVQRLGLQARYDAVVCADVLEHLRNAPQVLAEMSQLLNPGGVVVVSIPNVTHLGVILGLLAGRFVRTHEGLLDSTHVHFMDRMALTQLVEQAGFEVVHEDAVLRNLAQTEFAGLDVQALPLAVRSFVLGLPDAQVYQFVWTLRPRANGSTGAVAPAPSVPQIAQMPRYRVQVYFDRGQGFSETDAQDVYGEQTEALQTLQLPLTSGESVQAIRLDFSDRPGQLEFDALVARDAQGLEVWRWSGDWAASQTYHQCHWTGVQGWQGGRVVRCTGADPWVSMPVAPGAWDAVVALELRQSGPLPLASTDWPGLNMAQLQATLTALSTQMAERVATLDAHLASARALADFRQTDIDALRVEAATLRKVAQADKESLLQEMQARESNLQRLAEADKDSLRAEREALRAQLEAVLNSTSWRLTRGLRWASRLLGRRTRD